MQASQEIILSKSKLGELPCNQSSFCNSKRDFRSEICRQRTPKDFIISFLVSLLLFIIRFGEPCGKTNMISKFVFFF